MRETMKEKHQQKREAFINAFIKVYCREGLDGAFMRRLADGAGVSEGLLYRYFENKDDIVRQCTEYYHGSIQKELTEVFVAHIHSPQQMPGKVLEYIDSVVDICRFLLQVMAHPTYHAIMEHTGVQVFDCIMQVSAALQQELGLEEEAADGAALLLNSIVNDYILKKSRRNFQTQFQAVALLIWDRK